ncbi:MAG: chromate transporter, partial [Lachnospiraceae bacterium]|nr:chromate transporter [Lachnospiraceae bacterium]
MTLLRLYLEFFKTGLLAVGGGLATLPFLSRLAEETGWFTQHDLADMIAVSESTPGPIGVNSATYVGFKTAGIPGGIVATIGLITPSIIIVIIIASFLKSFNENGYVQKVFECLRPASVALITAAGISVAAIAFFQADSTTGESQLNIASVVMAAILLLITN